MNPEYNRPMLRATQAEIDEHQQVATRLLLLANNPADAARIYHRPEPTFVPQVFAPDSRHDRDRFPVLRAHAAVAAATLAIMASGAGQTPGTKYRNHAWQLWRPKPPVPPAQTAATWSSATAPPDTQPVPAPVLSTAANRTPGGPIAITDDERRQARAAERSQRSRDRRPAVIAVGLVATLAAVGGIAWWLSERGDEDNRVAGSTPGTSQSATPSAAKTGPSPSSSTSRSGAKPDMKGPATVPDPSGDRTRHTFDETGKKITDTLTRSERIAKAWEDSLPKSPTARITAEDSYSDLAQRLYYGKGYWTAHNSWQELEREIRAENNHTRGEAANLDPGDVIRVPELSLADWKRAHIGGIVQESLEREGSLVWHDAQRIAGYTGNREVTVKRTMDIVEGVAKHEKFDSMSDFERLPIEYRYGAKINGLHLPDGVQAFYTRAA